uniref:Uncharacterized protein n=1 Tax=Astyanax mexicanus TaxID=7994 RepID=A0A3B1JZM3_ASTMX
MEYSSQSLRNSPLWVVMLPFFYHTHSLQLPIDNTCHLAMSSVASVQPHSQDDTSKIIQEIKVSQFGKKSRTLKVSLNAVTAKIIKKRYNDEIGTNQDHPRKGRARVSSVVQNKFIRVTSSPAPQIRAPKSFFTEYFFFLTFKLLNDSLCATPLVTDRFAMATP